MAGVYRVSDYKYPRSRDITRLPRPRKSVVWPTQPTWLRRPSPSEIVDVVELHAFGLRRNGILSKSWRRFPSMQLWGNCA